MTSKDLAEAVADELGVVYSPDGKRLLRVPRWGIKLGNVTSYTVKPGTQHICDEAFSDCNSLKSIILPDSLTSIGDLAFLNCEFEDISIPYSVKFVGDSAFAGCNSLTDDMKAEIISRFGTGCMRCE